MEEMRDGSSARSCAVFRLVMLAASRLSRPKTQRCDDQGKCRCRLASAWIVQVIPGHRRRPFCQNTLKSSRRDVLLHDIIGQVSQTKSRQAAVQLQSNRVECQLSGGPNLQFAPLFFEGP